MLEFLLIYCFGLAIYPYFLLYWFSAVGVETLIYLVPTALGCVLLARYRQRLLLKLFIATILLPGTVICGSATVIPWPMALASYLSGSACTPLWALLTALVFNLALVFLFSSLISRIKRHRRRSQSPLDRPAAAAQPPAAS